jgi:hypothetical protein
MFTTYYGKKPQVDRPGATAVDNKHLVRSSYEWFFSI